MAGIYIHIPFCKQACYYCNFHFSTSLQKKDELIACLVEELRLRKDELQYEVIETIYFGGGTPSLVSFNDIQTILATIYKHYQVVTAPEITLEVNPDDVSNISIQGTSNLTFNEYKTLGINRLSIGIQSFFEDDLKYMNRAHNAQEAKKCLAAATRYFDNITIDLIYGIPNMSHKQWKQNLQITFDFGIHHISSYALTVEPKTALASFIQNGTYALPKESQAKEHFDILVEETAKNGFIQYEISNFGKPHYFSKHNMSYWLGKKYMGIGPSAHSFNHTHRSWNIANNHIYIQKIKSGKLPNEIEKLTKKDRFNEYIMTGLRTIWGVSLLEVQQNFGETFYTKLLKSSQKFIDNNLLVLETASNRHQVLKTACKGKFLADGLASDLFII